MADPGAPFQASTGPKEGTAEQQQQQQQLGQNPCRKDASPFSDEPLWGSTAWPGQLAASQGHRGGPFPLWPHLQAAGCTRQVCVWERGNGAPAVSKHFCRKEGRQAGRWPALALGLAEGSWPLSLRRPWPCSLMWLQAECLSRKRQGGGGYTSDSRMPWIWPCPFSEERQESWARGTPEPRQLPSPRGSLCCSSCLEFLRWERKSIDT